MKHKTCWMLSLASVLVGVLPGCGVGRGGGGGGSSLGGDDATDLVTCSGNYLVDNWETASDLEQIASCSIIEGDLAIEETDLTDLDALTNLVGVAGLFRIDGNEELLHVNGLSNLSSVGAELEIVGNRQLTGVEGLSNLISVGGDLVLWDIDGVPGAVTGMSSLTSVGDTLSLCQNDGLSAVDGFGSLASAGALSICRNFQVTSISGFSALTELGGLSIEDNTATTSIGGFESLTEIQGNLSLNCNVSLGDKAAEDFAARFTVFGEEWITNNEGSGSNCS